MLTKRLDSEFITDTRSGRKPSQLSRIGHAIANRRCYACGTRFFENDAVNVVLNDFATKLRGDNGQPVSLRFPLSHCKPTRGCRKKKHGGGAGIPSGLGAVQCTAAF